MADQLTGTVVAEKYRLDSLLRSGEVGDFYRGRHLFMDKPVTLKVLPRALALDENIRDQFMAEASSAAALSNPHILSANDFGKNKDESHYVVYEGFDGEPLKNSINTGGQFSIERATSIVRQIAVALSTAHENGFIQGSLTPDSILVSNTSDAAYVKVFDFEPADSGKTSDRDEKLLINVAYLAPENFSGLWTVDARSDIYSLGIILYQLLAGEVPFKGETPTDVMLKHAEDEVPALSDYRKDVPAPLETLVKKALAKDPDERFQTATDFVEELDKATLAGRSTGGRFWKTAAAMVVGIGVLAAALIYATSSKQTIPLTQLQPDANGQPVQPINPATGAEEQNLISMPNSLPGSMSNSDILSQPPQTLGGGDNYNPWAAGGAPPPGAPVPNYVPPGGQYYSIDPNTGSPFMPPDGSQVILVPVPANADTTVKPTPTPKTLAANANTQTAPPANTSVKPPVDKQPAVNTSRPPATVPLKTTPSKRGDNKPKPEVE